LSEFNSGFEGVVLASDYSCYLISESLRGAVLLGEEVPGDGSREGTLGKSDGARGPRQAWDQGDGLRPDRGSQGGHVTSHGDPVGDEGPAAQGSLAPLVEDS